MDAPKYLPYETNRLSYQTTATMNGLQENLGFDVVQKDDGKIVEQTSGNLDHVQEESPKYETNATSQS